MRAQEQRAAVGQEHLVRTASIIKKLDARKRRRRSKEEKLDDIQRYAFVPMDRHLFAIKAQRGSKIGISCGGILYPVRVPRSAAEKAAVLRLEAVLPDPPQPAKPKTIDAATIMASKIVEVVAAGRAVARIDFQQAGIADHLISSNFDKAMAKARSIEPRIDQMVAA